MENDVTEKLLQKETVSMYVVDTIQDFLIA
jgi:hypothetical protein